MMIDTYIYIERTRGRERGRERGRKIMKEGEIERVKDRESER